MQKQKRKIKKNIAKGRVGKVRGKSAREESEQGRKHEEGEGKSTSDGTLIIEGVYAICALFSYRNSYAVCARQSISSSSSRQGVG